MVQKWVHVVGGWCLFLWFLEIQGWIFKTFVEQSVCIKIPWMKIPTCLTTFVSPGRKMSRYFGNISLKYRVFEHLDMIYGREISVPRYFTNLLWILPISRDLLAFYHFIVNISRYFGVKWGLMQSTRMCSQTLKNVLRFPLRQVGPWYITCINI